MREERARQRSERQLQAEAAEAEYQRRESELQRRESELQRQESERQRQESERQRQHEMQILEFRREHDVSADVKPLTNVGKGERMMTPKLPPFDDKKDDMDAYIHRFESYAKAHGWLEDQWASNFSALLRGSALQVYYRLSLE